MAQVPTLAMNYAGLYFQLSVALSSVLKKNGFSILEAENGAVGFDVFEENSDDIDLVLVDWNMPVMTGIEFIEKVRANPAYENHKLVMVTTETEPTRMAKALMSGVDEFVMKPFTEDILVEKLKLIGVTAAWQ